MKTRIILSLMIAAFSCSAWALNFEAARNFVQGNASYTNRNYQEAVEFYTKAQSAGLSSQELFYDLGNAHYRCGNLGCAIANYRRAELLDPRDADCTANLLRAQSQTEDSIAKKEVPDALRSFFFLYFYLGLYEQAKLAAVFWAAGWIFLSLFILKRASLFGRVCKKLGVTFLVLFLLFFAFTACKYYIASHEGVVTSDTVRIHAGPDASYTEIFILHSGAEVKIKDREGGWTKISVSQSDEQDRSGWLENDQIQSVL
ncbi:SH3 domain-containing protein [bacterium]|nr:SH3 domain-containing protein [bacterium]